MTHDMFHVMEWHNGDKAWSPFSETEMRRRQDAVRAWMEKTEVDAVLFTSHHGINYHAGWLYCGFGRKYGLVLTRTGATTISAGVDGGQGWRRSFGDNVTYTDWRRDNYWRAVRQLTAGVRRLGLEFDQVSLDFLRRLEAALPGVVMVDVGEAAMALARVKSAEEIALIRKGAAICDLGARAAIACIRPGVAEYEVAMEATRAMTHAIARAFPCVELMDTWASVQSGLHTDGAHTPPTNKPIRRGEILSLNCFPMIFGYFAALQRTLFCGVPDAASLEIWQRNVAVHRRGLDLVRPGARCNEIAAALNDMYREFGLLKRRSRGYGHSLGVLSHYYGRDPGLELREDVVTELVPGMVVSMEPMVMIPEGQPGAGGYREHDILVVTETGAERLSTFPFGPEHNIVG